MLDLIGCGPENFRRELHRMCVAAIRIGADTDATCTVSFASISINNEEAKTSSNRATFITKSPAWGPGNGPVGGRDSAEWNEINRQGEAFIRISEDQSLLCPRGSEFVRRE